MPREEILPVRLASLLDALFEAHANPHSLYTGIITQLRPHQLAAAQKRIKKNLQQKGEISTEAAMLVACVLYRTGFPPQRILHFLSVYVRGTVTLSLFELIVGAIFGDTPPLPSSLLYDLTQYTYLEKRLLARKSLEISDMLKDNLSPEMLLYLYLLSLRDDLSNENVQLVALIMKNCFPALEVRTRLGGASLEEYGEIARAWRKAEQRALATERARRAGVERRPAETFDRDSASFFLDKYFSDAALERMRAAAPSTTVPMPRRRVEEQPAPPRPPLMQPADTPTGRDTSAAVKGKAAREAKGGAPAAHESTGAPEPLAVRSTARLREQRPDMSRRTADVPVRKMRPSIAPRSKPASPARPQTRSGRGGALIRHLFVSLVTRIPVIAAAVILALALLGLRTFAWHAEPALTHAVTTAPVATPAITAAPTVSAPPAAPTVTYVVKEGDSLWRIFAALRLGAPEQRAWTDFLSNTLTLNNLQDPDRIHAGSTLTLTAPKR